jgi:CRP-like cAMP-binding protein
MDPNSLSKIPFFSQLDDERTDIVLRAFEERKFKKGDIVLHQNDEADGMYVILSGNVEVEIDNKIITSLESNDFFGEMALVANERRSATIRVVSDSLSTIFLSKEAFENIKGELNGDVKREMLQRIIENYEEDFNS